MKLPQLIEKALTELTPEDDIEKWLIDNGIEPVLASETYDWYGFEREEIDAG